MEFHGIYSQLQTFYTHSNEFLFSQRRFFYRYLSYLSLNTSAIVETCFEIIKSWLVFTLDKPKPLILTFHTIVVVSGRSTLNRCRCTVLIKKRYLYDVLFALIIIFFNIYLWVRLYFLFDFCESEPKSFVFHIKLSRWTALFYLMESLWRDCRLHLFLLLNLDCFNLLEHQRSLVI